MVEKVIKSDEEWRAQLSDMEYKVLRKHGTERAFSNDSFPKSGGTYFCKGCGIPLFEGDTKFDSGTGWPSFYASVSDENVGESQDNSWFMKRTEVHCNACDGHLGHVFPDGPQPTGLRYCINGASLTHEPDDG